MKEFTGNDAAVAKKKQKNVVDHQMLAVVVLKRRSFNQQLVLQGVSLLCCTGCSCISKSGQTSWISS